MSTTNGMHGFWSATPSESSASKKAFYIRMQISLTQEEYAKQRTPFFVRFLTKAGKMVHLPIDTYRYVRPHSLETRFYFDEPDAFPVQTPVVCFDPDDDGDDDDEALRPLDLYIRLSAKAARLRDKLETHFPECRQVDVGFMENELMLFLRLRGNFMVAVSSDGSVPIFTWDRRCLIPMDRAEPKLGQGFKLTMPSAGGKAEHFWYERERVQLFASVRKVVQYADAHVYKGTSELRVDPARHLRSVDIVRSSPALRTNLRRLDRTMPYIKVATYSRVEHSIKVYADVHWRCEVMQLVFSFIRYCLCSSNHTGHSPHQRHLARRVSRAGPRGRELQRRLSGARRGRRPSGPHARVRRVSAVRREDARLSVQGGALLQ